MTVAYRILRSIAAGVLLMGAVGAALAADIPNRTLVTTDGMLYGVRAGTLQELGIVNPGLDPATYVVEWSAVAQDGTRQQGVLQASASSNPKSNLDLTYDEPTGSFVVLWREDAQIWNQVRLGVLRSGTWSFANLVPNMGFPQAFNPKMLLSHQTVTTTDDKGNAIQKNRSILSVIWWEEAQYAQARYAPIFLNEDISTDTLKVYDLPATIGGGGPTTYGDTPRAAYLYPALQLAGPGGSVLASFVDLNAHKHYVVRIDFPTNLGDPADPKNVAPERRRIPVVGIAVFAPIAFGKNGVNPENAPVGTIIGSSLNPTLFWSDGAAVRYVRFDGNAWSDARGLSLGESLSFDGALRLLEGMAARN